MKLNLLILYLFFFNVSIVEEGPKQLISCHVNSVSFNEFCDVIYQKSRVLIFYDEHRVSKLKINMDEDSITVESAVILALKGTELEVSIWNNNLIVMHGEKLLKQIPNFEYKDLPQQKTNRDNDTMTITEDLYIEGRKSDVLNIVEIENDLHCMGA